MAPLENPIQKSGVDVKEVLLGKLILSFGYFIGIIIETNSN